MTDPTYPRNCGTCVHFGPVADHGRCHVHPPGPTGFPRVEHDGRACERYAADVGPLLVEIGRQRRTNLALADRLAAASEVLTRAAERRVVATDFTDGGGI